MQSSGDWQVLFSNMKHKAGASSPCGWIVRMARVGARTGLLCPFWFNGSDVFEDGREDYYRARR